MNKQEREFIELTAEKAANQAVTDSSKLIEQRFNKLIESLPCKNHVKKLEDLLSLIPTIKENQKSTKENRKFIFWAILGLFMTIVAGVIVGELIHI